MAAEGEAFPELVRGGIQYSQQVNIFQWGHCDTFVRFFTVWLPRTTSGNNKRFKCLRARLYDIGLALFLSCWTGVKYAVRLRLKARRRGRCARGTSVGDWKCRVIEASRQRGAAEG